MYKLFSVCYNRKWNTKAKNKTEAKKKGKKPIAEEKNATNKSREKERERETRKKQKYNICCDIIGHSEYANIHVHITHTHSNT